MSGKPTYHSRQFLELETAIQRRGLSNCFRLHQPDKNIAQLYRQASVVCQPSFYEGCSNVICEALASGKPDLTGDVCDNSMLVKHGENGLLFNPHSPSDIADTILHFASLSPKQRAKMGKRSRQLAESLLAPKVFAGKYLELMKHVGKHKE